jgi:lysophospholipid hydrolase
MEVLTNSPRSSTIHAIRDSEIAIMPATLFNALSLEHPEITLTIARIIAARSKSGLEPGRTNKNISGVIDAGAKNVNLKTVAILPVISEVPILEFANRLKDSLLLIGGTVALLNNSSVSEQLGKHAFSRIGRLKLLSWLAEQEETHRLVIYVADGGVNSPWTQRCIRQADCILLVGFGDEDPAIGEYERLLIGMKTTARKELILIHSQRRCIPGSTAAWRKNRLWVHGIPIFSVIISASSCPNGCQICS